MNDRSGPPINASPTNGLRRELGRWDLALLFVVAVLNLNTVSSIATNGPVALWLWLAALLCFFLPQGIAVIELIAGETQGASSALRTVWVDRVL